MCNDVLMPHVEVSTEKTVRALVAKSQRKALPIRRSFVQQGDQAQPQPGPLATMVKRKDRVALDLYLTAVLMAAGEPHEVVLDARVWARALGLNGKSSAQTISRAWRRLEAMNLVRRRRSRRLVAVRILKEDGRGDEYSFPSTTNDPYLKVPLSYWTEGVMTNSTLGMKAMMLVVASLKDWSALPENKVPKWYGISEDTAWRGLKGLKRKGLLEQRKQYKDAPLAPAGFTAVNQYRLVGALERVRRKSDVEKEVVPDLKVVESK